MSTSSEQTPIAQQLRGLADDIRVKLHLAGMDAKDAWSRLEPRLFAYERKAEAATEKVTTELTKLGQDLSREMRKLLDQLTKS